MGNFQPLTVEYREQRRRESLRRFHDRKQIEAAQAEKAAAEHKTKTQHEEMQDKAARAFRIVRRIEVGDPTQAQDLQRALLDTITAVQYILSLTAEKAAAKATESR